MTLNQIIDKAEIDFKKLFLIDGIGAILTAGRLIKKSRRTTMGEKL